VGQALSPARSALEHPPAHYPATFVLCASFKLPALWTPASSVV